MATTLAVLIVEDNPEFRVLYRRLLQKSADPVFEVMEAGSVQEGLAAVRQKNADCMVIDYHLPDGNGLRFIETFKKRKPGFTRGHPFGDWAGE